MIEGVLGILQIGELEPKFLFPRNAVGVIFCGGGGLGRASCDGRDQVLQFAFPRTAIGVLFSIARFKVGFAAPESGEIKIPPKFIGGHQAMEGGVEESQICEFPHGGETDDMTLQLQGQIQEGRELRFQLPPNYHKK